MIRAIGRRAMASERARSLLGCGVGALLVTPAMVAAAPAVTDANVRVEFVSPISCTVVLEVGVEADAVEHRIEVAEGAAVELLGISGARPEGDPTDIGRTRALVVVPDGSRYTLHYRVTQPPSRSGRCPLWIPTLPTAGQGRVVQIAVRVPPGATVTGSMPSFEWTGEEGTASIGHLPAFVRVPYALPGEPRPWNIARLMDTVAVVTLLTATALWTRRRRGLPNSSELRG